MGNMQILLIEDELQHRLDFKEYISTREYPVTLYTAVGEAEGLKLVQMFPFDIIILDLEFHESDGDGLSFLKNLKRLKLQKTPYIIITTNNSSPITRQTARLKGGDYIFWKGKCDYSPQLVIDFAHTYYQCKNASAPDEPQPQKPVSLEAEIRSRICKVGINDAMRGRDYLVDAIAIVVKADNHDINLNKDVYPLIAKKYSKSDWSVIKAIESAINKAWFVTDPDTLAENYVAVVSGSKGCPTVKEFVFYYANQIKDESKA